MLRTCARIVSVIALMGAASGTVAAAYPERPITVVVAWPAGGATDLMTRGVQEAFAKAIGAQVVIKNVPGAAGTIGAAEAASAAADGYTLLVTPIGPMVLQPHRMKLTYTPASFEPVCKMVDSPIVLMSPPNSPLKTVADVVAKAKAEGGKLAYGSTGPGTIPHISMLGLAKAAGVPLKHVPYKGSADVVQALLSGTVELFSDQPNLVPQYNLTAIAIFSEKRIPTYKDTPTVKESGYDLSFSIWNAMFAPKGTPEDVLAKLEAGCRSALSDAASIDALEKQKQPIDYRNRAGLKAFVEAEYEKARVLLQDAGLKAQ
ncbi:MAG: tripartite tricarboxylate transporter substrate binding protein [Hyphomicrobiaceae bacterium]|nr:tripartite tricarboxylate transporter substrate binding protein [Hyphomicrobiaceae bacterium]